MALHLGEAALVATALFLVGLGFLVLLARPGAALNRALGAFFLLRGAMDLAYHAHREAVRLEDAAMYHAVAHWYESLSPLLTLLILHFLVPPRGRAPWRWWALGAAGVLTVVLSPLVAPEPTFAFEAGSHGVHAEMDPTFQEAFRLFLWGVRGFAVVVAALVASSPARSALQRRQAALVGLAFVFLMGHSVVLVAARATLGGQWDLWTTPSTAVAALSVLAALALAPRLAQPFDGRGRTAALLAALSPFPIGVADLLFSGEPWAIDARAPMTAAHAACLALAAIRYDLVSLGPHVQRRVEALARGMLAVGALLLPTGAAFALLGSTSVGLVAAVALGAGALALSPTPARVMARGLARLFAPDPLDPAVATERARLYADALGHHPRDERRLSELREEIGLGESDHLAMARMMAGQDGASRREPPLLGRYLVRRELGRGSFGAALLALDLTNGRSVVLKWFHARRSERRALAEADALAKVRHPRVVPLLAVERAGDRVFLVLEHVEGGSLQELLDAAGPLPPERALGLAADVLEGLEALHAAGLAHGDVKPANVLLGSDGRALLADLGAAQALQRPETDLTLTAAPVLGSYATLAPEILRGARRSAPADLYATGALLYRLLTNEDYVPLAGKDLVGATEAILHEAPRLPHPLVPPGVQPFLRRALAKEPGQRHPDARQMRRELEALHPALTGTRQTLK